MRRREPPISQFSLARQYKQIGREVEAAVRRVLRSGRYVLGPETEALEAEAANFVGAKFAVACNSGTDALHLALRALELPAGAAVLTAAFTFFASAGAILLAGLRPVLADIDPHTFNLSAATVVASLERHDASATVAALLPVDLFGRVAPIEAIADASREQRLPVIEDAAQAFGGFAGSQRKRAMAGTLGALGCFSFYPTKNLGAMGEGGMVVTGDAKLAERLRALRVHGSRQRYEHETLGWNARMHEVQAAVLRVKLPRVKDWNRRRMAIATLYERRLFDSGQAAVAGASARATSRELPVILPQRVPGHSFHQYVIRASRRDELRAWLQERGIGAEVYYPIAVHLQAALRDFGYVKGTFPEAERAAGEVLALPMFPELTDAEVERVAAAVAEFYK